MNKITMKTEKGKEEFVPYLYTGPTEWTPKDKKMPKPIKYYVFDCPHCKKECVFEASRLK